MTRPYGFAIVGCGKVATQHAEALARIPNARLTVVIDEDGARARALAERYGTESTTEIARGVERPDVDVVCICVPSGLHASVGVQAAGAGKHLVVEKPIDITLDGADRLIDACERASVALTVVSQHRYRPGVMKAHEILTAGLLGELALGDVQLKYHRTQEYYDAGAWRGTWAMDGGGALMNQGIHFVDVFRWLMGPVRRVVAQTATVAHRIEVEDVAIAILEFESGARGVIEASTATFPERPERVDISGSDGSLTILGSELTYLSLRSGASDMALASPIDQGATQDQPARLHELQLRGFLDSLDAGLPPLVTGQDGRAALEIVLATYASARANAPIDLPLGSAAPASRR